jgi:hypothetical protein
MYKLIKAGETLTGKMAAPRVYMGGQSRGRDWRIDFYKRFERADVTFINPRRETFIDPELEPIAHVKQVEWERKALDVSDLGIFWLGDGLSNQAARVEIGYMLGMQKPVLLGAQPGFLGIEHLVGFSGLVVASTLEGLMNRFASILMELQS